MSLPNDNLSEDNDLSERELKIGYWFTTHRLKIRQGIIIALIVFNVLLGGYSLWQWGDYLIFGFWQDKKLAQELSRSQIDYAALESHFAAKSLITADTYFFFRGAQADAAAAVSNPNESFFASFDYRFDLGGVQTAWRRGFILPAQEKVLAELGITWTGSAASVVLEMKDIVWQRISFHRIKNPADYQSERLNFSLTEVNFTPAEGIGRPARLTFNLANNSSFDYYEPRFLIILEAGGGLAGVEQVVFDRLSAGEQQSVDLRLFGANVSPSQVRLQPEINIFDSQAFLTP